jgi:hypothetical protein
MHDCGLYSLEDMQPVSELRMAARWKLGKALKACERAPEGGDQRTTTTGRKSGFWRWVKETLGMEASRVVEAQRIGCMPDEEMAELFEVARKEGRLLHYSDMVEIARELAK